MIITGSVKEDTLKLEGSCHCWVWDPDWPELMHPFASVIDTPLPAPPERHHILLDSKPDWVPIPDAGRDRHFADGPDESLMEWHERHDLVRD